MEQTALRPKPMPGRKPDGVATVTGTGPSRPRRHAARRRVRRLLNVLFAGFAGVVLVLSGIGLGAMGATAIGAGGGLDPRGRHTPPPTSPPPS
ncbi:PDZ domain-containing protein, partial [Streptomyces sp. URMC 128]